MTTPIRRQHEVDAEYAAIAAAHPEVDLTKAITFGDLFLVGRDQAALVRTAIRKPLELKIAALEKRNRDLEDQLQRFEQRLAVLDTRQTIRTTFCPVTEDIWRRWKKNSASARTEATDETGTGQPCRNAAANPADDRNQHSRTGGAHVQRHSEHASAGLTEAGMVDRGMPAN